MIRNSAGMFTRPRDEVDPPLYTHQQIMKELEEYFSMLQINILWERQNGAVDSKVMDDEN